MAPFFSSIINDQVACLSDKVFRASERVKSLNTTVAEQKAQIHELRQKLTAVENGWAHPADDDLARELNQLYYELRDWTIKTIRGMKSGTYYFLSKLVWADKN